MNHRALLIFVISGLLQASAAYANPSQTLSCTIHIQAAGRITLQRIRIDEAELLDLAGPHEMDQKRACLKKAEKMLAIYLRDCVNPDENNSLVCQAHRNHTYVRVILGYKGRGLFNEKDLILDACAFRTIWTSKNLEGFPICPNAGKAFTTYLIDQLDLSQ